MGVRTRHLDIVAAMRREAADPAKRGEAVRVVECWNKSIASGRDRWWSPTIRAAIVAGTPWLDIYCSGCQTSRSLDLRAVDRHPLASVGSLVLGLRCSWCRGVAPMPKITGLTQYRSRRAPARTKFQNEGGLSVLAPGRFSVTALQRSTVSTQ
jgi:hypothetical protein